MRRLEIARGTSSLSLALVLPLEVLAPNERCSDVQRVKVTDECQAKASERLERCDSSDCMYRTAQTKIAAVCKPRSEPHALSITPVLPNVVTEVETLVQPFLFD